MEEFIYRSHSAGEREKKIISVCIPAYKEESLNKTFFSLFQCERVESHVSVYVFFNAPEDAPELVKQINIKAFEKAVLFCKNQQPWFDIVLLLDNNMPAKKAGVGLARRTVMEYATVRFKNQNNNHVLTALDADCTVSPEYFKAVETFFFSNKKFNAASLYFEHELPGEEHLRKGIIQYELHLRYLKNALKWSGFPWYFHTVGSSMAVRAETYIRQGGMNTRQAGEDYYFLHKLMPHGFGEINECSVFPEARISDRVPFGTGRSLGTFFNSGQESLTTYNPLIFHTLRILFDIIENKPLNELKGLIKSTCNDKLSEVLTHLDFDMVIDEALSNSASEEQCRQRIWKWFSGFTIIKIMHALREKGLENVPLTVACNSIFGQSSEDCEEWLHFLRKKDKRSVF